MRLLRTVAGVVIGVVLASGSMVASDPIGVIAILTKVQMEPNDQAPERIKLWGAFSVPTPGGGVHRNPARKGVTYFKLTPGRETEIRNEWADLKAMAGTGRAVGFGSFWVPANDRHARVCTLRPRCESTRKTPPPSRCRIPRTSASSGSVPIPLM